MKHLCVLISTVVIYSNASFFIGNSYLENEKFSSGNSKSVFNSNQINNYGTFSEPLDSIVSVPENTNTISNDSINIIPVEPIKTSTDTTGIIQPEPPLIKNDSISLIPAENLIPADSTGLIQMERKLPEDSTGLLRLDSNLVSDSLGLIQPGKNILTDSLSLVPKVQTDTVPRIKFRSVYIDSIEQGNPNFMEKKVLEIKWITEKRDTAIRYKNIMGFNAFYGVYTYGVGFGLFKRLGNDADFIANVNLSYAFDRRTVDDIDSAGNLSALDRESRIYPIVFNVGLEKYFMQNRIDWKIKPVLIFGFAPAIIPVTPNNLTFFKSLKKLQLSYGVGVFAALGFDWQAFNTFGINLTARYSFIPILAGKEIYYYKGFEVKNVGGFYVNLGVTLLQQYFSKD